MGIMGYISEAKQRFRRLQTERSYRQNIARAEELKKLRQERLAIEGKVKLEKARQKEIRRIAEAKQTIGKGTALRVIGGKLREAQAKARALKDQENPFSLGKSEKKSSPFDIGSGESPFVK